MSSIPATPAWAHNTSAINTQTVNMLQAVAAQGGFSQATNRFTDTNMMAMLASRMGWNLSTAGCPFRKIVPCQLSSETAVVFLVQGDRALLIEDDLNLYPSDALVTQLRLLGETS